VDCSSRSVIKVSDLWTDALPVQSRLNWLVGFELGLTERGGDRAHGAIDLVVAPDAQDLNQATALRQKVTSCHDKPLS
jgi:hypothetical protein